MSVLLSLSPNTVFAGDYRVIRPLSAGGMGTVYVAEQLSTARERALKVMLPDLVNDADLKRRFEQEARIGARIESEHVVEVVGAGIDPASQTPWLAMELLQGETLSDRSKKTGPMPPPLVAEIFAQLAHAIAAAHDKNIVHRDLKPENIFLAHSKRAGAAFVLKVLDFGIAKLMNQVRTSATGAMGTPLWMAPEQAHSGMAVTPAADVWALGLIAFALLAGRPFWKSAHAADSSAVMILREMVMDPIPPASARARELGCPSLPGGFDAWFARCVDREPSARFQHARQMEQELARVLGGAATGRAPATSMPSGTIVGEPLAAVAVSGFVQATPPPVGIPTAPRSVARPRGSMWPWLAGGGLIAGGAIGAVAFSMGAKEKPSSKGQETASAAPAQTASARPPIPEPSTTTQALAPSAASPSASSHPLSCEEAKAIARPTDDASAADSKPMQTALNDASRLSSCRVPPTTRVTICAVWDGEGPPKGVTVTLAPADPTQAACVEKGVRALESKTPLHAAFTTTFTPEQSNASAPKPAPAPAPKPAAPPPKSSPCGCNPADLDCNMKCSAKRKAPPPSKGGGDLYGTE